MPTVRHATDWFVSAKSATLPLQFTRHPVIHGTGSILLPAVLGHEGAGTVEALGEGVTNQKTLVGSYYGSGSPHQLFAKMLDFHQRGLIDVAGLIQRHFPLSQINEGFAAIDNHENGRGVIVF